MPICPPCHSKYKKQIPTKSYFYSQPHKNDYYQSAVENFHFVLKKQFYDNQLEDVKDVEENCKLDQKMTEFGSNA